MIEKILAGVAIVGFILFIATIINNRFKFAIIKIEKAEEDINLYLQKKKELIERTIPIIKKELKLKEYLNDINSINDETNNFNKNDILKKLSNEIYKTIDENEKLYKSDSLMSIINDLSDNEENIVGAIKFFNDTVVDYNKLAISFPTNIIAFVKRYKKKQFYNNEKREMFEILNEK